ncbi:DExH-box ATP-dependent RNA helicase DExH6 [Turnera subulata]|uniref:DExH-box ATP-dependent RNA helicase DExH6 n=1 Tax=Turnera subulata TaxID=218843 RepID=A0A9Q0FCR1_9ROSI|nr:DExH-box ATP-dependent RNA helicase DExH6 [Turnera subulata]
MGRKRQKKATEQQQNPKVAESTRIRVFQILEDFRAAPDQVYTFEANLSNTERKLVHEISRKMGMTSKSSGRGQQRCVSVYKSTGKLGTAGEMKKDTRFTFSEYSQLALQELFSNYPPEEAELERNELVSKYNLTTDKIRPNRDDIFCKPSLSKADISKKVESLRSRIETDANLRQIVGQRSKLPISSFRDAITSAIDSHQVVLISGETGCGKTTQVPQFLLDHMWGKKKMCKLVCTQPRRISATSVAERIAYERGENIGDDVGYKIRLESKGGKHSSIVFCTNGVLLRVLVSNQRPRTEESSKPAKDAVSNLTHIIVDEIHERDRYSDFMLAIIRDILPSYPKLRLVLMSATLDAERFSQYFGGCPVIHVPGFTFPVKTFYLEDVLSILKSECNNHLDCAMPCDIVESDELTEEDKAGLDEAITLAWSDDEFDSLLDLVFSEGNPKVYNYQHSRVGLTPLMVFAGKGRVGDVCMLLSYGVDCQLREKHGLTALELAERENQLETANAIRKHVTYALSDSMEQQQLLDKYLATINPELVDVILIEQLLRKICINSKDGAVLVFLPGWDDINRTRERLLANPYFKDVSKFLIITLHSLVPAVEQRKVFKNPPNGCRKIVLATNIAESAITIDDVVYVIDSGRMKEKSYDPYNNVSTLQSSWVSKASAKQREGRAGRCQPGICYHLYSKLRAASLPDFQVPEIKRMPIEELCLQVKLIDPSCQIEHFLRKLLDPPVAESIRNAIMVLQDIGALSLDEKLTELGEKLGCLPVHPLTTKMIFFAILMNCLDPALTLACAADYRDPFTLPMLPKDKKKVNDAKMELASLYGGHGDQLAVIAAFECWKNAKERGQEARFCSQYFISSSTMSMLHGMRKQLQAELIRNGFIPEDTSICSLNARDPGIVNAVIVAGSYPKLGRFLQPKNGKPFVETANGAKVRLHPQSLNSKLSLKKTDQCPLIVYDEITRGDGGMHIRNCTIVGPLPLLLLATEIVVASAKDDADDHNNDDDEEDGDNDAADEVESDEDGMEMDDQSGEPYDEKVMSSPDNSVKVVVDRWLYFESTAIDVAQIYCLRERLSAAILFKAINPHKAVPDPLGASAYATACILSYDGLSGISLPANSVDSLTSMVHATELDKAAPGKSKGNGQSQNSFLSSLITHGMHQTAPSHSANAKKPVSTGKSDCKPSTNNFQPPISSGGMYPYQGPLLRGPVKCNSETHGQLGPTGDSSKRHRGNALRYH